MSFLTRLAKTFRIGRAQYYVGKDLDKNKYYEYPPLDGSTDARRTRRVIDYHVFKELGEHDQNKLPTQWLMWLRHTRRSAPSIEEILQDQERIRITQHNAKVLEQRDTERRLQLEQRAAEEAEKVHEQQSQIEPSMSQNPDSSRQSSRVTAVPTAAVSDEGVKESERNQIQRQVDMEVWEASRRRIEEKNAQQSDAFTRRADRRADLNQQDTERDRARRAMNKSPLEAFDVSFEDDDHQQQHQHKQGQQVRQEQEQPKPRFGRSTAGPGEQWKPQEWSPAPRRPT